jgi:hypothetical protein
VLEVVAKVVADHIWRRSVAYRTAAGLMMKHAPGATNAAVPRVGQTCWKRRTAAALVLCSPPRILIMTPLTIGWSTSKASASGVTCCTTGPIILRNAESLTGAAMHWAISFKDSTIAVRREPSDIRRQALGMARRQAFLAVQQAGIQL